MFSKSGLICKACLNRKTCALTSSKLYHFNHAANRRALLRPTTQVSVAIQARQLGILVRVLRGALKIRYILLGSAAGGSVYMTNVSGKIDAINVLTYVLWCLQKFEEWKKDLPDFAWLNDVKPSQDTLNKWRTGLLDVRDKFSPENGFLQNVSSTVNGKFDLFNQWLEEAREARRLELESKRVVLHFCFY